ncbi:Bacteriophytochrome [Pigmentiphaga humi]|uniref:histidine kinase n=1 Tax=Pigmentiphaga humi TaxID=2478468 RepID=A0A3P4B566_9BURK|nr:hybrid sensor histidine kinase/response regulator [Pigmentiphaga humi]VCU70808.1 Bacteriophytochrome [Pigmentiphaga humi]
MSRSTKILVVDDLEQNIVALEALVRRPDVELLRADSGAQALELLLENDVALALVDVQMPGMDGFELAEFMRGSPRTRHVPIIFLTAADRNSHRTFRGYEAGAVDFLYKPIDPHILRSKIEVFVQLQNQRLQLADQLDKLTQLLRTNEMFVAVLGHDLRNPLSAVVNLSEALVRAAGEGQVHDWALRIRNSGNRMSRMVDQLLDLAHMRSGTLAISSEPVDLSSLCSAIIDELDPLGDKRTVTLDVVGDARGSWDPDRLQQVFSNLLGNALQHGTPGHPVRLQIDGNRPHALHVRVVNAGTIASDVRPHLFQPFEAGKLRRSNGSGLGLGLYIARELINTHQGQLRLDCETPGLTIFEVELPRRAPAPAASQFTLAQPADSAGRA